MPSAMWSPVEDKSDMAMKSRPRSRAGDRETSSAAVYNPYFTGQPRTPTNQMKVDVMDRQQIIRTIKEKGIARQRLDEPALSEVASSPRLVEVAAVATASLEPSPQIDGVAVETEKEQMSEQSAFGLSISRPGSALHKGDFSRASPSSWSGAAQESPRPGPGYQQPDLATSPPAPWHDGFPNSTIRQATSTNAQDNQPTFAQIARPRAVSQISLSKSFSYQAPTSPLVNQSNAEDIPGPNERPQPRVPEYAADQYSRRRTFSPRSFQSFNSMLEDGHESTNWASSPPLMRRESSVPYKAHQPRRSASSFSSLPQTPYSSSRRSSAFGSSPLQSAMIGSFEESILRGRMSSTPSKPLDFTAHIGVLGFGDCRPSLKCPPHITVPFPAVYYNYGTSSTTSDSQPSPYVGLVDLEGRCAAAADSGSRRRTNVGRNLSGHSRANSPSAADVVGLVHDEKRRRTQKQKRRSDSPLQEPKNAYRIPCKGQLQIIIKNPNKTAVKLFLVPYDVTDIQPGQKTFIRQRSYSAGPIIDMPLSNKPAQGLDGSESFVVRLGQFGHSQDKPVLRYLVHLHICCTSKGRVWLYRSIRVVFANRVPDGKEKLQNDVQLPEPKYSIYKSSRTSAVVTPLLRPHPSDPTDMDYERLDELPSPTSRINVFKAEVQSLPARGMLGHSFPHRDTEPSFRFPGLETVTSRPSSRGIDDDRDPYNHAQAANQQATTLQEYDRVNSPKSTLSPILPLQRAISPATDSSEGTGSFTFSRSNSNDRLAGSESLLSKRLRDLGMSRFPSPNGDGPRPPS